MSFYTILRQQNPTILPQFWQSGFFFNELDHLRQQGDSPCYVVTALNQATQQTDARCAFFGSKHESISPAAAPFGSVEFAPTLPHSVLADVLKAVIDMARNTGSSSLRIVNYPHCYAPEQAHRLTAELIAQGFGIVEANQNFYLPVAQQSFDDNLSPAEGRRLRKCRQGGFRFRHWAEPPIDEVVRFLAETRHQQGYRLTIPPLRLAALLNTFPDQFPVFVVEDGATLAALTIAVRVRDDILYNFLPASHPDYTLFSPMVMLTEGLYTYCRQQGIRLLDLGVSLDGNYCPKPSLMRFKRNLGAHESPKLVFQKRL